MFLNYCTNILVVGFVYSLSDFSRSRSSDLKAFCKKRVFKKFQNSKETFVAESTFKVEWHCQKLWHRSFSVNFTKFLRIAMFFRTSTKTCFWNFRPPHHRFSKNQFSYQPAPNFFKNDANQTYFWLPPYSRKKIDRGSWGHGISKGIEKNIQK